MQLDSYATTKLQQWLRARVNPIGPEIKPLIERLHNFAWQVHAEGLDATLEKIGVPGGQSSSVAVLESIADLLCRDVRGTERAIAMKSVQEALILSTAMNPDLSVSQLGKELEKYLEVSGSRGMIQLFLGLYLSNLIFFHLHDSLHALPLETFDKRVQAIERLCQSASRHCVYSWEKWSKLTETMVISGLELVSAEMKRSVEAKNKTARPKS